MTWVEGPSNLATPTVHQSNEIMEEAASTRAVCSFYHANVSVYWPINDDIN